jgi:hypothetical protein
MDFLCGIALTLLIETAVLILATELLWGKINENDS